MQHQNTFLSIRQLEGGGRPFYYTLFSSLPLPSPPLLQMVGKDLGVSVPACFRLGDEEVGLVYGEGAEVHRREKHLTEYAEGPSPSPLANPEAAPTDLSDAAFLLSHSDETATAAVRAAWASQRTWEPFCSPFTGTESLEAMRSAIQTMSSSTRPRLASAAKSTRKGTPSTVVNAARRVFEETAEACQAQTTSLSAVLKRKRRGGCACLISSDLGCVCGGAQRIVSVEVPCEVGGVPQLVFGLRFSGAVLLSAGDAQFLPFIGSRLQQISSDLGSYSVTTSEDIVTASASMLDNLTAPGNGKLTRTALEVSFSFQPRHLPHSVVRSIGRPLPALSCATPQILTLPPPEAENVLILDGEVKSCGRKPSGVSLGGAGVVGEDLGLVEAGECPQTLSFRCVRVVNGSPSVASSDGSGSSSEGFCPDALRGTYPSPFAESSDFSLASIADIAPAVLAKQIPDDVRLAAHALHRFLKQRRFDDDLFLFLRPVDPVRDRAPGYLAVIKRPMDLGTVVALLRNNLYTAGETVLADVQQVWDNCKRFNPPGHDLHHYTKELESEFARIYKEESERGCGGRGGVRAGAGVAPSRRGGAHVQTAEVDLQEELVKMVREIPQTFTTLVNSVGVALSGMRVWRRGREGGGRVSIAKVEVEEVHVFLYLRESFHYCIIFCYGIIPNKFVEAYAANVR